MIQDSRKWIASWLKMQHLFCDPQHVAASSGSGQADLEKLCSILEAIPLIKYICLDVANGYSEHFVEFVKTVRGKFPNHTIMVRKRAKTFLSQASNSNHLLLRLKTNPIIHIFLDTTGWKCGDGRNGGRAHSVWSWHHQSGHRSRRVPCFLFIFETKEQYASNKSFELLLNKTAWYIELETIVEIAVSGKILQKISMDAYRVVSSAEVKYKLCLQVLYVPPASRPVWATLS